MGGLNEYLERQGIKKKQIPTALLALKGLNYVTWFGTLAMCYRFQPVRRFFTLSGPKRFHESIQKRFSSQYEWCHKTIQKKSDQLANWKYFKPIPESIGLKSKHMSTAIVENFVFYKAMFPILFPLQFWLIIKALSHKRENVELTDFYSNVNPDMIDNATEVIAESEE